MPHRAAKLGPALIVSFIASASFIPMSYGETPAADECLSAPKEETPSGGHWHYRIEHPSNRHCWYLRGADGATAKTAASTPSALTKPAMSNVAASSEMPGSVANAHAELAEPRTLSHQDSGAANGQLPSAMADTDSSAQAANSQATISQAAISRSANSQALTPADVSIQGSVVASRWPDQMAALTPAASSQAASPQIASPPAVNEVVAEATSSSVAAQPAAKNNVRVAVADSATETPLEKPRASTQMMLIVMLGAFSVAGLVASAVGLGGRRRKRVRLAQAKRRANWDAGRPAQQPPSRFRSSSPSHPASPSIALAAERPNIGLPLELHEPEELDWHDVEPGYEIEDLHENAQYEAQQHDAKVVDMLSRLARSAQV